MKQPPQVSAATGKLGILLPGLGAVSTTFIAGCLLARRGLGAPIGSLTQLATIRLGKRTDNRTPLIKDFVPLAGLDQLEFGAWDLFSDDAYESASHAEVLSKEHLALVKDEMSQIKPMSAVFYPEYVKRLHGTNVKEGKTKADMVELGSRRTKA
jgi:myo-inositol-1-phosphate synthase